MQARFTALIWVRLYYPACSLSGLSVLGCSSSACAPIARLPIFSCLRFLRSASSCAGSAWCRSCIRVQETFPERTFHPRWLRLLISCTIPPSLLSESLSLSLVSPSSVAARRRAHQLHVCRSSAASASFIIVNSVHHTSQTQRDCFKALAQYSCASTFHCTDMGGRTCNMIHGQSS